MKPIDGVDAIRLERQRQIDEEGWTPEHDDQHHKGQMAIAAACYAAYTAGLSIYKHEKYVNRVVFNDPWPWDPKWDKRRSGSKIRKLQKAGALIAAEIDRLKRLEEE